MEECVPVCPHVGVEKPPVRPVYDRRTTTGGTHQAGRRVFPNRRRQTPAACPLPAATSVPTPPHASSCLTLALEDQEDTLELRVATPHAGCSTRGGLRDHPRGSSREQVLGPASERSHPPAGCGVGGEEQPVHAHGAVDRWVGRPEADTPPLARNPHAQVRSGGCRTWCARAKQRPACSRCAEDARQPGQHRWTALARNR